MLYGYLSDISPKKLITCQALSLIFHPFSAPSTNFGICYGTVANNLPPPADAINLIQNCGIAKFRLYEPHPEIMSLNPTRLVSIATRNEDLSQLASSPDFAKDWISTNYVPYENILDIIVGNEVIPGENAQ